MAIREETKPYLHACPSHSAANQIRMVVLVTYLMMHLKMGKRIHLCEYEIIELADALNLFFDRLVDVPRIRIGNRQTIETLINEEALLLAKFLREEREKWTPRTTRFN